MVLSLNPYKSMLLIVDHQPTIIRQLFIYSFDTCYTIFRHIKPYHWCLDHSPTYSYSPQSSTILSIMTLKTWTIDGIHHQPTVKKNRKLRRYEPLKNLRYPCLFLGTHFFWLVVSTHLGWWHSQYMESHNPFHGAKPPTRYL